MKTFHPIWHTKVDDFVALWHNAKRVESDKRITWFALKLKRRKRMKKFPCRCYKCFSRKTFIYHPDSYRRVKRCKRCGGFYRVDWYRKQKEHKRTKYLCCGYYFPHRRGSRWCLENKKTQWGIPFNFFDSDPH